MAVGLNAIREICARSQQAMTDDLLQDLVQYKTAKNKTVMMAARSLMQLYRNVNPELLRKKDRGVFTYQNFYVIRVLFRKKIFSKGLTSCFRSIFCT